MSAVDTGRDSAYVFATIRNFRFDGWKGAVVSVLTSRRSGTDVPGPPAAVTLSSVLVLVVHQIGRRYLLGGPPAESGT
jgi:hypothetical protein